MSRFFPVLILGCALLGAILGWNSVAHYRSPADSGEARLRERAASYYQASRLFDYLSMAQLYTPAKQLNESGELLKKAKKHQASFGMLPESNRASLQVSASSITPESLELELEGDWAMTWGECIYPTENSQVTVKLDKMVWVKSGGDWWIFTWTKPEIAAYGNPPDASYTLLQKRKIEEARALVREMQQAEQHKAMAGGAAASPGAESPGSEVEPEAGDGK